MNELQVDAFIADIAQEMELLRNYEETAVTLTMSQEMEIDSFPKSKREEKRKQYLAEANARKKDRLSLLISAIEDKIKASGLPAQTVKELLDIIDNAKDAGWKFSPQALAQIEEIKEKQNVVEDKKQEVQQADTNLENIAIATTVGAVVATLVNETAKPEKVQLPEHIDIKPDMQIVKPVAGTFMIDEKIEKEQPERIEKITRVAQKAMAKIDPNRAPLSLDMIKQATNLLPIESKYAQALFLKENPAYAKDLAKQEAFAQENAIQKGIRKIERKKTGINPDKNKPENAPQYEGGEKIAMARVKKIKQIAGTSLTMQEVMDRLHPTLRKYYEQVMRREHPEFFENRDKEAQRKKTIAKIRMNRKMYRKGLSKESPIAGEEQKKTKEAQITPMFQKNKKPRLHRTMELRSTTKRSTKTKQHSAEVAKNVAFVNKRKKSVA